MARRVLAWLERPLPASADPVVEAGGYPLPYTAPHLRDRRSAQGGRVPGGLIVLERNAAIDDSLSCVMVRDLGP